MGKKGKKMIMVLLIMGLSISATGCKGIMKEEPDATKGVKNDGDLEGIYIKNDSKFYKPVTENQTFNSSTYEPGLYGIRERHTLFQLWIKAKETR